MMKYKNDSANFRKNWVRLAHRTLVVTIHCAEGFVICADSKLADADPPRTTQKLFSLGPRTCCALLGANTFRGSISLADTIQEAARQMGSQNYEERAQLVSARIYEVFRALEQSHPKENLYQQFGADVGYVVMAIIFAGMVGQKRYYGETRFFHNSGRIQPYDFVYEPLKLPEQKIQGPRNTIHELLDAEDERLASYRESQIVRRVSSFPGRRDNERNLPELSLAEARELGRIYLEATFEFAHVFQPAAVPLVGPPVQFAVLPKRGQLSLDLPS